MRSQLPPALKIDMLSTSIGSCGRRRPRNAFRDFAAFAFLRLVVFMLFDSFQSEKTNRASMPSRIPSNVLSITNHNETRHSATGWRWVMIIRSALLALLNVALTPVSPESEARYFTKCEILVRSRKLPGGRAADGRFDYLFGRVKYYRLHRIREWFPLDSRRVREHSVPSAKHSGDAGNKRHSALRVSDGNRLTCFHMITSIHFILFGVLEFASAIC